MPVRWIVCPDKGQPIEIEECLRCGSRCMTVPTIKAMTQRREWTGHPSTTQLLNGTMLEFLKITKNYAIDPQKQAFALLGTRHHKLLEDMAKETSLPAEMALGPDGHDVFDLLEPENGSWTLTDYKTWGSFRVVRALGIVKIGTGKEARFRIDPSAIDLEESELQLNRYRIMLEELGVRVGKMQLQITVRDGGLKVAKTRGIIKNIYLRPIMRLGGEEVMAYFSQKTEKLLAALDGYWRNPDYLPEPCDDKECWGGNRCRGYCEVWESCPKGTLEQREPEAD